MHMHNQLKVQLALRYILKALANKDYARVKCVNVSLGGAGLISSLSTSLSTLAAVPFTPLTHLVSALLTDMLNTAHPGLSIVQTLFT